MAKPTPAQAATWRQRAQRLRRTAEKAVTAETRRRMLETAARYDEMASVSE
jgi:hypothetical protein